MTPSIMNIAVQHSSINKFTMNTEQRIEKIINSDITDDAFIADLLVMVREEEDDLVRAIARSFVQENSFKIITRLLGK